MQKKTRMKRAHIPTGYAFLHATIGGWVGTSTAPVLSDVVAKFFFFFHKDKQEQFGVQDLPRSPGDCGGTLKRQAGNYEHGNNGHHFQAHAGGEGQGQGEGQGEGGAVE